MELVVKHFCDLTTKELRGWYPTYSHDVSVCKVNENSLAYPIGIRKAASVF